MLMLEINKVTQERVLDYVKAERTLQDHKFGFQDHDPLEWMPILGEEYGEVCKEVNGIYFEGLTPARIARYRQELIQVAAVAVAALEALERGDWTFDQEAKPYRGR